MLICKRCNHEWKSRTSAIPNICPRCKSKKWDKEKIRSWEKEDIIKTSKESIKRIITTDEFLSKNDDNFDNDLCAYNVSRLMQTMIVLLVESEKLSDKKDYSGALNFIDICKDLVIKKLLPEEMYSIFVRIQSNMLYDMIAKNVDYTNKRETQLRNDLVINWNNTELGKSLNIEKVEHRLPDLDRIDILAKDKNTGQDVIIELKKFSKDGYRQLRSYGYYFENPRLINISEKEVPNKKEGIEYFTFTELYGQSHVIEDQLKLEE